MKEIIVFTDGSCIGNGKKVSFGGYGIYFPYNEFPNISSSFTLAPVTNQRAELYSILVALQLILDQAQVQDYDKITVYTDSEYSIKSITEWAIGWEKKGWKTTKGTVKNLDLIKPLHKLYQANKKTIKFVHVRSHTSNNDFVSLGNAEADKLAIMGSKKAILDRPKMNIKESGDLESDSPPSKIKIHVPDLVLSPVEKSKPIKVIIKRHKVLEEQPKKSIKKRIKVKFPDSDSD